MTSSGMRKWTIHFHDGKSCTMLSQACQTQQQALEAAIEKFGNKVASVS